MSLLGLDVGTTGCKALIISADGNVLACSTREYPFIHPQPGWVELDPALVWRSVREVIFESVNCAGTDAVLALSISCHGESITPVDSSGAPLCNTIVSLDRRTAPMLEFWETFGRDRLQEITGLPLHHKHSINRLLWLRLHRPDIFERAWKFLCYEDFILMQMGLPPIISAPLAARTMAYDVHRGIWSEEILSYVGIDPDCLPHIQDSGSPVGTIPAVIAKYLGLGPKVLVISGGHDQPCALLGTGILASGTAVDSIGTVEALTAMVPEDIDEQGLVSSGYPYYPHVLKPHMVTMAVNPNGGALFRWYRDNLAGEERCLTVKNKEDAYRMIIAGCTMRPSAVFVLPYFSGRGAPHPDAAAQGAILGLHLGTTRHEIAWAILESHAFELKHNILAMAQAGVEISSLRAVGGGAKSLELLKLRATILDCPVTLPKVREASCLGAAMLAGYGLGIFGSSAEAVHSLFSVVVSVDPEPRYREAYRDKFQAYLGLCADAERFISPNFKNRSI